MSPSVTYFFNELNVSALTGEASLYSKDTPSICRISSSKVTPSEIMPSFPTSPVLDRR